MTKTARSLLDTALSTTSEQWQFKLQVEDTASVTALRSGILELTGFDAITHEELIRLQDGTQGLALNISETTVGAVLLGGGDNISIGDKAYRTYRRVDIPVSDDLRGRVLDPLCRPLDEKAPIQASEYYPLHRQAPGILERAPVKRPLATGIKAIDAAIPIGRGQRELIVGDRQTGKTSLAVDTILNQKDDVTCIYCAIGQRQSSVARVLETLRKRDALQRTVMIVASGEDPPGLQYLAPYAAASIAEYFMAKGQDTLVVYDDLTYHARAYRELSLLLRRPPGREAYPGDIFYLHARLLERATQLNKDAGGGSMTALPIVETQAENISAYIPTNLISITDGQIVLSRRLFEKAELPAIDIGQSVSRVGGKAQSAAYRAITGDLKLYYAQFKELEAFSRFGTRIDEDTKFRLERGRRVRAVLKQAEHAPLTPKQQLSILLAATQGLLDQLRLDQLKAAEQCLREAIEMSTAWSELNIEDALTPEHQDRLLCELKGALILAGLLQESHEQT